MKQRISLFILILILAMPLMAKEWYSFTDNGTPSSIAIKIVRHKLSEYELMINVNEFILMRLA